MEAYLVTLKVMHLIFAAGVCGFIFSISFFFTMDSPSRKIQKRARTITGCAAFAYIILMGILLVQIYH